MNLRIFVDLTHLSWTDGFFWGEGLRRSGSCVEVTSVCVSERYPNFFIGVYVFLKLQSFDMIYIITLLINKKFKTSQRTMKPHTVHMVLVLLKVSNTWFVSVTVYHEHLTLAINDHSKNYFFWEKFIEISMKNKETIKIISK